MIAVATLGVEAAALCERFEECGLAGAILTDEERDVASELYVYPMSKGTDVEWISGGIDLFGKTLTTLRRNGAPVARTGGVIRRLDFIAQLSYEHYR